METVITAAYWASYLVNNDSSGLNDRELALADAWLTREGLEHADFWFDEEPYFSWSYDLYTGDDCRGGNLLRYQVIRRT